MDTREIATEYRLGHWAQILQDRTASGMSIREYCKNAGIAECVFYYWQKKLRIAASRELAMHKDDMPEKGIVPQGWAVCAAKEARATTIAAAATAAVTIEIGRYRIGVEAGVDAETLEMVCRVLTSLC